LLARTGNATIGALAFVQGNLNADEEFPMARKSIIAL
jgi:hypothetical protein